MRRNDKAVRSRKEIDEIIRGSAVCRLAMASDDEPYLVPLSFGYDGKSFFFHSAPEGKKLEILRTNNRVWFALDTAGKLLPSEDGACGWSVEYMSVMGSGRAFFVSDSDEKRLALDLVMSQYAPGRKFDYQPGMVDRITVIRVDIETITGKKSPIRRREVTQ